MPQVSKLSPMEWQEIKEAMIAGVSYKIVAERYDVEEWLIRKKASREKWPIPSRIEAEMVRRRDEGKSREESHKVTQELVADSLESNGHEASLLASNLSLELLRNARLENIAPIKHVADLKTAMAIPRTAAGLDKPQQTTQINLAMFGKQIKGQILSSERPEVVESEAEFVDSDEQEG